MNRPATELIIELESLGFPRAEQVWGLIEELDDLPVIYQVGLGLFMAQGPAFVRELVHQKRRVFLDLKFHDSPQEVARAVLQAALLRVEMTSIHLSGGSAMLHAARDALAELESIKPRIIGVGVLPSFDDLRWAEVSRAINGHASQLDDSMSGLVDAFSAAGIDGILCRPHEFESIRARHPALYTIVDAVVTGPVRDRPSAILVGQGITQARKPRQVVEALLAA